MSAPVGVGDRAPGFVLKDVEGQSVEPLAGAARRRPVLLAFFKDDCPTCWVALPVLERMREALAGEYEGVPVYGISQDNAHRAGTFARQAGARFPVLLDGDGYPVSRQYGLTIVPTLVLVGPDGLVLKVQEGFHRNEYESIVRELAGGNGFEPPPLFGADEQVPESKPG